MTLMCTGAPSDGASKAREGEGEGEGERDGTESPVHEGDGMESPIHDVRTLVRT